MISIVICTYNRADLARRAIASVLEQNVPKSDYELIIIDNASVDHTHQMVEEFLARFSNVRYVYESNIGISIARNRGWQEACGEYVAYLDDDAIAPNGWLEKALKIIADHSPLAFGGPFYPYYLKPKPAWFKDEYGSNIKAHHACFTDNEDYITGGNMCVRRDILAQDNWFPEEFGHKGQKISFGEDTYVIRRMVTLYGKCLYFDPDFFIYHLVRPEKMNLIDQIQIRFASGRDYYNAVLLNKHEENDLTSHEGAGSSIFARGLRRLASMLLAPFQEKQKGFNLQQYLYEFIFRIVFYLGVLYSMICAKLRMSNRE